MYGVIMAGICALVLGAGIATVAHNARPNTPLYTFKVEVNDRVLDVITDTQTSFAHMVANINAALK